MKKKASINIENVVASATLDQDIDLGAVVRRFPSVEYKPEQFPGLVYRIKEPRAVVLLFGSGKVICTGARRLEDVEKAVENIRKELSEADLLR